MSKLNAPCHNCTMRCVAERNGKIYSCHSDCPEYRVFKAELERAAKQRKDISAPFVEQFVERKYQVERALHRKQRRFYS